MVKQLLENRPARVFTIISAFFVANALIAECIGGKIFSLEALLGIDPVNMTIMGETGLSFSLTCGVLLWPLEFIVTDIVNEYYGPRAVKRISYTAVALIGYAFVMFYFAMGTTPPDWWVASKQDQGIPDMQLAFSAIFGQGMWIIFGSLTAFLIGQIVDVFVFHRIKRVTGDKWIWLVLFIAFKIGNGWSWQKVLAICLVNYTYKFTMAFLLTPVIYFAENRIDAYLGHETARRMKKAAMGQDEEPATNIPAAG
jgi:uncharacterized integral membrane protein (TIGR00697 family)